MPINISNKLSKKIIDQEINERVDSLLECPDLILLLVYVSPVRGTTHMQKQTFLLWQMLGNMHIDAGFSPCKFGPHSQLVADSIKNLKRKGLLREGLGKRYYITNLGTAYIKQKVDRIGIKIDRIVQRKTRWDEWDAKGIRIYVYRTYPEYATNTEVSHLKW